jgi:hypothetical protein
MQALWSPVPRALPPLAVFPLRSSNCVSKCTSTAWDYEASNELPNSTIPLWCTLIPEARHQLGEAPESEKIPEVTELQELQTFGGNKRNKLWIETAVNSLASWNFCLGYRRPQCRHLQVVVESCQMLAMFVLCYRWLEGISHIHLIGWPNFQLDLHDTRVRERILVCGITRHGCTVKPCPTPSQPLMLKCSLRLLIHYLKYPIVPLLA